ncbi:hypothetical protein SELMODRAFT_410096 [Selaginella moellendorffii]|uniref:Uncharacterized protein n=1 Tax=Selaginella moellendorffii TaxID=88036 RepID=D8RDG4_SELML|nr:hypothetical protein SELMODRAFT_410096 [Selaginella moellendorffii]
MEAQDPVSILSNLLVLAASLGHQLFSVVHEPLHRLYTRRMSMTDASLPGWFHFAWKCAMTLPRSGSSLRVLSTEKTRVNNERALGNWPEEWLPACFTRKFWSRPTTAATPAAAAGIWNRALSIAAGHWNPLRGCWARLLLGPLGFPYHHPRPAVLFMEMMYGQVIPVDPLEQQQLKGRGNDYAYTLRFVMFCILNITNPNKNVDFYHADLEITVLYRSEMQVEVITHSTMVRTAGLKSQRFRIRFRCLLYQMLTTGELLQDCKYTSADECNVSLNTSVRSTVVRPHESRAATAVITLRFNEISNSLRMCPRLLVSLSFAANANAASIRMFGNVGSDPPKSINWRTLGAVTPVKDRKGYQNCKLAKLYHRMAEGSSQVRNASMLGASCGENHQTGSSFSNDSQGKSRESTFLPVDHGQYYQPQLRVQCILSDEKLESEPHNWTNKRIRLTGGEPPRGVASESQRKIHQGLHQGLSLKAALAGPVAMDVDLVPSASTASASIPSVPHATPGTPLASSVARPATLVTPASPGSSRERSLLNCPPSEATAASFMFQHPLVSCSGNFPSDDKMDQTYVGLRQATLDSILDKISRGPAETKRCFSEAATESQDRIHMGSLFPGFRYVIPRDRDMIAEVEGVTCYAVQRDENGEIIRDDDGNAVLEVKTDMREYHEVEDKDEPKRWRCDFKSKVKNVELIQWMKKHYPYVNPEFWLPVSVTGAKWRAYKKHVSSTRDWLKTSFPEESYKLVPGTLEELQAQYDTRKVQYERKTGTTLTRRNSKFLVGVYYVKPDMRKKLVTGNLATDLEDAYNFVQGFMRIHVGNEFLAWTPEMVEDIYQQRLIEIRKEQRNVFKARVFERNLVLYESELKATKGELCSIKESEDKYVIRLKLPRFAGRIDIVSGPVKGDLQKTCLDMVKIYSNEEPVEDECCLSIVFEFSSVDTKQSFWEYDNQQVIISLPKKTLPQLEIVRMQKKQRTC